jgi:hypothetical protein
MSKEEGGDATKRNDITAVAEDENWRSCVANELQCDSTVTKAFDSHKRSATEVFVSLIQRYSIQYWIYFLL